MQIALVLTFAALLVGCTADPQQDQDQDRDQGNAGSSEDGGENGNFDEIDATKLPLPNGRRMDHRHGPNHYYSSKAVNIPATCQCQCERTRPLVRPSYVYYNHHF